MKITFLGLGIMGYEMAKHLHKKGFDINVWNRDYEKAIKFVAEFGGIAFKNIEEAVLEADFVFMCLGDDNSVLDITSKIIPIIKREAILVDHTTVAATTAKKIHSKHKNFIDAPVTGGQGGAKNGTLCILCGGDVTIFEKVKPIFESYASKIAHFGAVGSGQVAKMANQICIAGVIQSLAESISFAKKAGINLHLLYDTIKGGAGGSWQMANRAELMISEDYKENFGFPVEWMVKDLKICLDEANKIGANLEMTEEILKFYEEVSQNINSRYDTSSLILRLKS